MICCKECLDLLYDYIEGSLDQETTDSLEEHFQECPPCISFMKTYKSTTMICRDTLNQVEVPVAVREALLKVLKENKKYPGEN
jgi:predicted anti-sigma-YlaC factor YlaD